MPRGIYGVGGRSMPVLRQRGRGAAAAGVVGRLPHEYCALALTARH